MLYSEFVTLVNNQLSVEANRRGTELLRAQNIKNALVDLQRLIPAFRVGQTTTYAQGNLTAEGQAMLGQFPAGALPKAMYIYSTSEGDNPKCKRYRLDFYPWAKRQDMVCGRLAWDLWWGGCCGNGINITPNPCPTPSADDPNPWNWCKQRAYVYTVSPHGDQFLIYPSLTTKSNLLLVWDGYKMDFDDGDAVPFPEQAAEPVAEFVLAKIRLLIDKNPQMSLIHRQSYNMLKLALYRDFKRTQYLDNKDEEYASNLVPPPGESIFGAGSVIVPFLQNITALDGLTANCLAAIGTTNIGVDQPVTIVVDGLSQTWTLKSGTDATDTASGILRPNDYNASTNAKVWYLQNPS